MLDDWRLNFCSGVGKRTAFLLSPHDLLLDQDSPLRHGTCSPLRRKDELLENASPFLFNPLNAELNPICHLLALLGGATIIVVSRLRVNLLMRENWSAEDDGHPRTPCSLQPPCFVTIESECSSTLDPFRDLNENHSNAVRDIYWSPPFLLCHVSRSVRNSHGLQQVPARAVTSARKASSKKMSQRF